MRSLILMLASLSAFAYSPSLIDLKASFDPINASKGSHIDLLSQTAFEYGKSSVLVCPEVSYFLNGTVDFGLNIGHRHKTWAGVFGHHVFFDRAQFKQYSVNQFGTGLDYLSRFFEIKINYYHPTNKILAWKNYLLRPCKWMEIEKTIKLPRLHIGLGAHYLFGANIFAHRQKIIVPFEKFSVGIGHIRDTRDGSKFFLCTTFHLFSSSTRKLEHTPHSHNKRAFLATLPPAIIEPSKKTIKKETEKIPEEDVEICLPPASKVYPKTPIPIQELSSGKSWDELKEEYGWPPNEYEPLPISNLPEPETNEPGWWDFLFPSTSTD